MYWTRTLAALGLTLSIVPGVAVVAGESTPLDVAEVSRELVSREHLFDGKIEAVNRTTVSAQTAGRVEEVFFDVDDFVGRGEVIVRLKDTEQRARVDRAQAALEEARARQEEARSEFQRIRELREQKVVSKAAFDKATADLEAAKARLVSAQAALDEAEEQLEYTRVRAPYSGIVTERLIEVGETANVGTPLMSGVSLEELRANVDVPQELISAIRSIAKARILFEDGSSVEGEDLTFFPYADPEANTFRVRVDLPEGIRGLFPGMLVKVAFVTGVEEQLVVPARAIAYRSEVTGVYVVDEDGRVSLRQVRLGRRIGGDRMEILAGLEAGERVALDPVQATAVLKEQSKRRAEGG
jgi:RND family efflux transporter MFP subunit